jgi:hypothetical protein
MHLTFDFMRRFVISILQIHYNINEFFLKTPPPVLQTTAQSEEVTVNAPIKSVPAPIKQKVQLEISSHNIIAPNTVVEQLPEMETFEVELVKDQQGLGITIAGYVCEKGNPFILFLIKSTVFLSSTE